jgi:hypothetical protein
MKTQHKDLMRLKILFFTVLLFFPVFIFAQETGSCAEKLKAAQSLFDKGQVEQVPAMLEACMKSGFNREEGLAAYKLLIQSFLFEEKIEKADSAMLAFLKKNPEYVTSPTDHSSFVNLFNTFEVKPVVQLAFHFLTNVPYVTFLHFNSTAGEAGAYTYSIKPFNLYTSLEAKFEFNKKIDINVEIGYSQISFTNVEDYQRIEQITYIENQKRIELPVTGTYNFKSFGKFTPFIRLGGGPALTLGSLAKVAVKATDVNGTSHPQQELDRKDARPFMDLFVQAGGGIELKTRGGFITAEIRSNTGLLNQARGGGINDYELYNNFHFVDDDFHLNTMNITFGYTQIFYKPTKRKE